MKLSSKQIAIMLERSSKIDRNSKSMSMNERYYRILYFYQKRKEEERISYTPNPLKNEVSNYNKIIIGHNTTTWDRISNKAHNLVINKIKRI